MRWIEAGRLSRVLEISDAMRALHKDSLLAGRNCSDRTLYRDLIRPAGQVRIWEGERRRQSAIERQIANGTASESSPSGPTICGRCSRVSPATSTRGLLVPATATPSARSGWCSAGQLFGEAAA